MARQHSPGDRSNQDELPDVKNSPRIGTRKMRGHEISEPDSPYRTTHRNTAMNTMAPAMNAVAGPAMSAHSVISPTNTRWQKKIPPKNPAMAAMAAATPAITKAKNVSPPVAFISGHLTLSESPAHLFPRKCKRPGAGAPGLGPNAGRIIRRRIRQLLSARRSSPARLP
jgi:hypothetical protein